MDKIQPKTKKINIYNTIKQLVKTDNKPDISNLLPINKVYKGYGQYSGIQPITFDTPKEYGKNYVIKVNLSDDTERIEKLTMLNTDIEKFNEWVKLECKKFEQGVEGSKFYKPMSKYQLWQFVVTIAESVNSDKVNLNNMIKCIDSEEFYYLKETLSEKEFVPRFNKTIYDYIRMKIDEAKEIDMWDKNNIWYTPNQEFGNWFQTIGLRIADIDSFNSIITGDIIQDIGQNNIIKREGDTWNILFKGEKTTIKHKKGIDYIAYLLLHPNMNIDSMELYQIVSNKIHNINYKMSNYSLASIEADEGIFVNKELQIELLDQKTLNNIKNKIEELEEKIKQAMVENDNTLLDSLECEQNKLKNYLSNNSFKDQIINFSDSKNRARITIQKAIKSAKLIIMDYHPKLYEHLDQFIKTGFSNSYMPDTNIFWSQ